MPAPPEGDGFWQSADPVALGLDPGAIGEHLALAKASGADAVLVAYRGKVVSEWYSPRYRTPMGTMSSAKSITGLLAGLLVADGKLAVDDPVSRFIPGWSEGRRGRVTVRHLLTMSSGLSRVSEPARSVGFAADKNGCVVAMEPSSEPGTRWDYSNEGVQLLSPILEKAAGMPLQDYARDRLFRPLGMDETRLMLDAKGHAWTYADAQTTLRDFARLGELMRNKGRWRGRPVVPEAWVNASTRPCPLNPTYGYLWWLVDDPKGFAAKGYLDTHCYVFPGLELVVARMQARPYLFATEPYEPKAFALFKRIVPEVAVGPADIRAGEGRAGVIGDPCEMSRRFLDEGQDRFRHSAPTPRRAGSVTNSGPRQPDRRPGPPGPIARHDRVGRRAHGPTDSLRAPSGSHVGFRRFLPSISTPGSTRRRPSTPAAETCVSSRSSSSKPAKPCRCTRPASVTRVPQRARWSNPVNLRRWTRPSSVIAVPARFKVRRPDKALRWTRPSSVTEKPSSSSVLRPTRPLR